MFLEDIEWKALCCYVNKTPVVSGTPPSIRRAIFMIAAMVGHLGAKETASLAPKPSGGLERLSMATEMQDIFAQQSSPHPMQSGP
ncbi:MAG: hypothetical protein ABSC19_10470 [Syntrophorhabdales bacterium]